MIVGSTGSKARRTICAARDFVSLDRAWRQLDSDKGQLYDQPRCPTPKRNISGWRTFTSGPRTAIYSIHLRPTTAFLSFLHFTFLTLPSCDKL